MKNGKRLVSKFSLNISCDSGMHPIVVGVFADDSLPNNYVFSTLESPCLELYGQNLFQLSRCCSDNFAASGLRDDDFAPNSYDLLAGKILSGVQTNSSIASIIPFWIYYSDVRDFHSMRDTIYRYKNGSRNLDAVSNIVGALTEIVLKHPFYGGVLYFFYMNPCHQDSFFNKYIGSLKDGNEDSFDRIIGESVNKIRNKMDSDPYFKRSFLLSLEAYQFMFGYSYCFLVSGHSPYPEICHGLAFPLLFNGNFDVYRRVSGKLINTKYLIFIDNINELYAALDYAISSANLLYDSGAKILAAYVITCIIINGLSYSHLAKDIPCDYIEFVASRVNPGINGYILNSFLDMNYGATLHDAVCAPGYPSIYNSMSYKNYFMHLVCSSLKKKSSVYDMSFVDSRGKEVGFDEIIRFISRFIEHVSFRSDFGEVEDLILLESMFCMFFNKNDRKHVCNAYCLCKLFTVLFDLGLLNTAAYFYVHIQKNLHKPSLSIVRKHIYSIINQHPQRDVVSSIFKIRSLYYKLVYTNLYCGKSYQDLFSPDCFSRANLIKSVFMSLN